MTEGLQKGEIMALGGVQAGYAQTTYAYRKTTTITEEFYSDISSAAQLTEQKNNSKVIGLTMIPYGNTNESYGMKAQYAAESTPDNPVIQVASNYGGEWVSYKVNVNDVDPRNASQLEMFALLSYSDDQGISDGGTFGSYHQLKIYADNAQMNGYWEGNGNLDSFLNAKHDWITIINQMTDDYSQAGVYSQYLSGSKLAVTLSHFSVQHMDFDNLKIEDKSADTFSYYEMNIPGNILKAWLEVAGESGAGMDNDMFSHMTSVMIRRFSKYQEGCATGNSIEAALKSAREALQALEYPLTSELAGISGIQEELEEERAFYQSFIEKLKILQKEQNGEDGKVENTKAADDADGADTTEVIDFMEFIRKRMEEIFVMVKNGDTEASFQIGNSSFTIKEWEEFLEKFDAIEDAIRELMREEQEKRTGEAAEAEAAETTTGTAGKTEAAGKAGAARGKAVSSETVEGINALVSESTKCTYPSSVPEQEDTMYITWYTEEGIFCRKAGQSEGYEWSINFENKEDYLKVMEFLDRFDREDNLRFAAHENFWQDFLKDEIDIEGFMKFFEGTDHGVPNYAVSVGDSMYVDRDKIQWAKYMNSPGNKLYTREEMMKMQEELIEANKAKLTKLSNSYSRIYQKTHPGYKGESIFCEYPGGPLYTADEIAERMMQNLFNWQYLAKWI